MVTATTTKFGGLSNRIKNIWSALVKYEDVKTTVDTDAYIFSSLEKVNTPINPYPINWRLEVLDEEQKYLNEIGYKTIDLLYENTPKYFIDKYLKSVEKLKINPDIEDRVNDFTSGWEDVIGLHVRSWYNERSVLHNNKIFEEEIKNLSNDRRIFLCSDNSDVINYFKQKYSNRIIVYPQDFHLQSPQLMHLLDSLDNSGTVIEDLQFVVNGFIDSLILSKCSTIVGTYGSTFTEVAWWFSRCKSNVIIPNPLNDFNKQFFERFNRKIAPPSGFEFY